MAGNRIIVRSSTAGSEKRTLRRLCRLSLFVSLCALVCFAVPSARAGELGTREVTLSLPPPSPSPEIQLSAPQTTDPETASVFNKDYWLGYGKDSYGVVTAPGRWGQSDWIKAGLVLGGAGVAFALDPSIQRYSQRHRSKLKDNIANKVKIFGSGLYDIPLLAGLYVAGELTGSPKARQTALLSLESFAITGALVQIGKDAVRRPRPSSGRSARTADGPGLSGQDKSFPSGDAGVAFSIASVVADEYHDEPVVSVGAYTLATLVGLERINGNAHWLSDVYVSSALGYFIGRYIVSSHHSDLLSRLTVAPVADGDFAGLIVGATF